MRPPLSLISERPRRVARTGGINFFSHSNCVGCDFLRMHAREKSRLHWEGEPARLQILQVFDWIFGLASGSDTGQHTEPRA